jgi:tRNA pseudouridine55 synthase
MGRRRRETGPVIDGVLIIDKPVGPTSHDVVARVRRALGQSRVGHTGTLDPAATGVLVVCLGRATKLVRFLQAGRKTYAATMLLGVETDSQDADGRVVAEIDASGVDERSLCEALTGFQGEITQIPPMVSAVKIEGERLHAKARRGEVVEREPRPVTVHELVLDAFEPGERATASFLVTCSTGTYVRTLAHDVGQHLGVGGSLTALRRVANGPFTLDDAITLEQLDDLATAGELVGQVLDPGAALARMLPAVEIDDPQVLARLVQGQPLPDAPGHDLFAVTSGPRLVGVYAGGQDGGTARPELVWTRPEELPS